MYLSKCPFYFGLYCIGHWRSCLFSKYRICICFVEFQDVADFLNKYTEICWVCHKSGKWMPHIYTCQFNIKISTNNDITMDGGCDRVWELTSFSVKHVLHLQYMCRLYTCFCICCSTTHDMWYYKWKTCVVQVYIYYR